MTDNTGQDQILAKLSAEDAELILGVLLAARKGGEVNPMLPTDFDIDGDGVADCFTLGQDGKLAMCHAHVDATLFESTGEEGL